MYRSLLKDSLTSLEFFQIVSSAMSNVGEAHSNVEISEQIKTDIKTRAKLLPFDVHISEKRAFIRKGLSDESGELVGHELLSINGKKIDQIMQITDSISCQGTGYNQARIYRTLSYSRNFALAFFLYIDQSQSYLIEYRALGKEEVKATVLDGILPDFEIATSLSPPETKPPFSLTIDESRDVAIIEVKTFAHFIIHYKVKEYLKFYQKSFAQIEEVGVSNLIIDVRGNRGGQEKLGGYLLSYLIENPIQVHQYIFAKRLDYPLLDSLGVFHHTFSSKKFQAADSGYVMIDDRSSMLASIEPAKKNKFTGDVYILADGNCFSACNIFVALADFHKVGRIVGEESGGNYQDSEGYWATIFQLPNSGLGIEFRLWHLRTAVESPLHGRGISPDVSVQPTVNDILADRDASIEKVYELIRQTKSQ